MTGFCSMKNACCTSLISCLLCLSFGSQCYDKRRKRSSVHTLLAKRCSTYACVYITPCLHIDRNACFARACMAAYAMLCALLAAAFLGHPAHNELFPPLWQVVSNLEICNVLVLFVIACCTSLISCLLCLSFGSQCYDKRRKRSSVHTLLAKRCSTYACVYITPCLHIDRNACFARACMAAYAMLCALLAAAFLGQ